MTIDLGFAYLNDNVTIIDVPGMKNLLGIWHQGCKYSLWINSNCSR